MRDLAYLLDPLLEHAVRRRVRDHQGRELVLVLDRLVLPRAMSRRKKKNKMTERSILVKVIADGALVELGKKASSGRSQTEVNVLFCLPDTRAINKP